MTEQIRGLERWEGETKEFNRRAGKLKRMAGAGIIDALEHWYSEWEKNHTERNKREYMLWRLRLHLKHNDTPEFLQELDEVFDIHLTDEKIGKTFWDVPAVKEFNARRGFNWRRDSGDALRGGSVDRYKKEEDE